MNNAQRRIDILVIALTALIAISSIAMFIDSAVLLFIIAPITMAVLLYLSVVEVPKGAGKTQALVALHIFNMIHAFLWVGMLVMLPLKEATFGGLPPSTGLMIYILWPFSAIAGSLLYAYVSKKTGLVARLEREGRATTVTEGASV